MATAKIGSMQEFQPGAEPIMAYLERLQAYLDANDVHVVDAKRTFLCSLAQLGTRRMEYNIAS